MTSDELKHIIEQHALWLSGDGGTRADLQGANLRGADLRGADLRSADLSGADLSRGDLRGADLRGADLRLTYLSGANLSDADLQGANLRRGDLRGADLRGADLRSADLSGAELGGANLGGATLPHFQICPEVGGFIGWKKLRNGAIVELLIPNDARRTSSLVGRKCRCEFAFVQSIVGGEDTHMVSKHDSSTVYEVGAVIHPDSYNDDIRAECTHGIHFFITRKEAEEY